MNFSIPVTWAGMWEEATGNMKSCDTFSAYHPIVGFTYFCLVMAFSMVFIHPVCLAITLLGSTSYALYLGGSRILRAGLRFLLPLAVLTAVLNPLFNHQGVTILLYFRNGNPLTLESVWYGLVMACVLVAMICWFSCYNRVMTSDKFVYLFGRIAPAFSLLLSITLRFIPRFRERFSRVSAAQRCVGCDIRTGGVARRLRNILTIFSVMLTWALEGAIVTADSMRCRGHGLPGRTAFSLYRFSRRDAFSLVFLLLGGSFIAAAGWLGALRWWYIPIVYGEPVSVWNLGAFVTYLAICLFPLIVDGKEAIVWRSLKFRI